MLNVVPHAGPRVQIGNLPVQKGLASDQAITKDADYFEVGVLTVEKAAKALAAAATRKWCMRCHKLPEGQEMFIIPGLSHGDIVKSAKLPDEFKWDTPEEFCIAEVMQGLFKQFGCLPAPYNDYPKLKTLINEAIGTLDQTQK
ncbi:hypothetical protein HaLaN_33171, partial [Haematococcus lacustris]